MNKFYVKLALLILSVPLVLTGSWGIEVMAQALTQPIPASPGVSAIGSPTFVNVGALSADVLNWVVSVSVPVIGIVATGWITRLFQQVGVNMTDASRARLQEIVVNGINLGAAKATDALKNAPPVDVKNAAVAHAIGYVQTHGADTLKALGFDPHDSKTTDAIEARILSAIANPAIPTASVLNPPVAAIPNIMLGTKDATTGL